MRPLQGIRVLDFSTLLPGPLATLMLAEAGAEVTKVEPPGGEEMRRVGPRLQGGGSALFTLLNQGKRSLTLDLNRPSDLDEALELVATADILVEQFRPGVMQKWGLGYQQLATRFPALIYCSITGYGQVGSRAQVAGHDLNYMADAGLLFNVATPEGAPVLPPTQVADIGAGSLPAVINILLALRQREMTGTGCHLDIAMAECVKCFQVLAFAETLASGESPRPNTGILSGGSPRYGCYKTSDSRWIALAALENKFWRKFCALIELPPELRGEGVNTGLIRTEIAERIGRRTAEEWLRVFAGQDVCVSVVRSLDEVMTPGADDQHGLSLPISRHFRG